MVNIVKHEKGSASPEIRKAAKRMANDGTLDDFAGRKIVLLTLTKEAIRRRHPTHTCATSVIEDGDGNKIYLPDQVASGSMRERLAAIATLNVAGKTRPQGILMMIIADGFVATPHRLMSPPWMWWEEKELSHEEAARILNINAVFLRDGVRNEMARRRQG